MATMKNLWGTVCGLALATALFSGCDRIKGYVSTLRGDDRNPPVARVYDTYLYRSDLRNIVPKGSSPQDSTAIVSRYIDAWITRQLILKTAQMNMPEGDLEKEIARLTKEEERLTKEIARSNGMLGNPNFINKAPEAKVQAEKEKLANYQQMMEQVQTRLEQLKK